MTIYLSWVHPAFLAAGSVRFASEPGRLSELPLWPKHPGVHCLAARHSLGSSAHWFAQGVPVTDFQPFGFPPFPSSRSQSFHRSPRLSCEKTTSTCVSVPRCLNSSGNPVGCGVSVDRDWNCFQVSGAPSIFRTPSLQRWATPTFACRRLTGPKSFLSLWPKPLREGSDRKLPFTPEGDASPKRCVVVVDRTIVGHKNETDPD